MLDIHISDGYAYIKTAQKELTLLDISLPNNPQYVSEYEFDTTFLLEAVSNSIAYILESGEFSVLDFSDPAAPDFGRAFFEPTIIKGQAIQGNYLYIVDNEERLLIYDLTVPAAPALLDSTGGLTDASRVFINDNTLVIADWK